LQYIFIWYYTGSFGQPTTYQYMGGTWNPIGTNPFNSTAISHRTAGFDFGDYYSAYVNTNTSNKVEVKRWSEAGLSWCSYSIGEGGFPTQILLEYAAGLGFVLAYVDNDDSPKVFRMVRPDIGCDFSTCQSPFYLRGGTRPGQSATWLVESGPANMGANAAEFSEIMFTGPGVVTVSQTWSPSSNFDEVVITNTAPAISAGPDQSVCGSATSLAGDTPPGGYTGNWTSSDPGVAFGDIMAFDTNVSGLQLGQTTFTWTVTDGICSASDDVKITSTGAPSVGAGVDFAVCGTNAPLAAPPLTIGETGLWTTGSTATIADPTAYTSNVNNLPLGPSTFTWTLTVLGCSASDNVIVTNNSVTASAGPDQEVCTGGALMSGSSPSPGTGIWSFVIGTGTFDDQTNPNSAVAALGQGLNRFAWSVTLGACSASDTVDVVNNAPTAADAGTSLDVCASTAMLAGNTPTVGTGVWSVDVGPATVDSPSSPTSSVSGLGIGLNTFTWTITQGVCASGHPVNVINNAFTVSAGGDQTVCAPTATLAGDDPAPGTGAWTVVMGTGSFTSTSTFNTTATGLGQGVNTLRWTITKNSCTFWNEVVITNDTPSAANAGTDQNVCAPTATLAASVPTIGSGLWSVVTGAGTFATPSLAGSAVSSIGPGPNTFRWTVTNA